MRFYAISDEILTPATKLPNMLELAIEGGCKIFQFRNKSAKDSDISTLCLELNDICKKNKVDFILNDRVELAIKLNINGIHIGKDDENISFEVLRKNFSGIIGISCYGDINRALRYQNLGANYVAFGSIFQSKTKQNAKVVNIDILNQAKEMINIPICAIGGINTRNIAKFQNTKLDSNDMIAMINSIWIGDIKSNLKELQNKLAES
ncbi:thiamine phosphate synthase [Helicobacter sp. MIT 99-5507]|uniref:thiamine phosphate synthase n=1 Tax=Helicobacter sp. MIT 99-5507 TaxID=152489 RepID=UPI002162C72B|nr:thiamine phosphate synthase [Helicobacter sp. MIT 99-5507]